MILYVYGVGKGLQVSFPHNVSDHTASREPCGSPNNGKGHLESFLSRQDAKVVDTVSVRSPSLSSLCHHQNAQCIVQQCNSSSSSSGAHPLPHQHLLPVLMCQLHSEPHRQKFWVLMCPSNGALAFTWEIRTVKWRARCFNSCINTAQPKLFNTHSPLDTLLCHLHAHNLAPSVGQLLEMM